MKIIFLDIDGVLNVITQGRDKYGSIFHKQLEDNLAYIIESTGAKIIISSTWRFSGLQVMQEMWSYRCLPGEVIGITPDCADLVESGQFEYYDMVERGHEIQEWLEKHQDVENYVILDDTNDMLQSQHAHFVRCSNNLNHPDCVDIGYGLTRICADEAIRILNSEELKIRKS